MPNKYKINDVCEQQFDLVENTKITNLNTDCMEIVFEHLDFHDLLNVADSCKQFYCAASRVYKRKYLNTNPIFDKDSHDK